MILRLLRKDVAVFRPRDRAVVALVFILGALQTVRYDPAYLWFGIMLAGALVAVVPVVEWRLDTDRMLSSLPVPRGTVVTARYLSAVLACAIAWVAWVAVGYLLAPLLDAGRTGPALWATLEGTMTYAVLSGLLVALFLPLYFRLGLGRAVLAFAFMAPALYLAAVGVARAVGFEPGPAAPGSIGTLAGLPGPGTMSRVAVGRFLARTGSPGAVVVVSGMAVLLALSAGVSKRMFSGRDL
ncbi:MAG: ABC-2 transporter permease [Gemmatimonadota bacterium]